MHNVHERCRRSHFFEHLPTCSPFPLAAGGADHGEFEGSNMVGPFLRSLYSAGRSTLSAAPRPALRRPACFPGGRGFSSPAVAASSPPSPAGGAGCLDPSRLRNVAVIAHVDHGKTTLMDELLRQCGANLPHERALDSISLERERGITIASKVRLCDSSLITCANVEFERISILYHHKNSSLLWFMNLRLSHLLQSVRFYA